MDCARNIITANFSGGTSATTAPLWQWDYGQVLCITGIEDLPAAFEVHFSTNRTGGVSTVAVGADGQVTIPNELLTIGKNLNAWIYLSDAQGEGETEYSILIPVKARPMPETYDAEVSGEFDDVVRQVSEYAQTAQTAADNAGASASAAAASADSAAASASAADVAKTAAETAQGKAEDAQTAAETAAQTATEKAQQTARDAAQTAQSKADAESAAQRAEAAQTGAESAKTDAETAAQGAADSASAASASAANAGQAASAAAQSATAAAQSAASIEGDVQTATQKAAEATAAADQAVAAKDAAVTAQTAAETAETNAGQSASTATTKASEAAQSASNAADSETAAEAAATRAETAAASLVVDDALSDTSTNPVQNKVITGEVTQLKNALDAIDDQVELLVDLPGKVDMLERVVFDKRYGVSGIGQSASALTRLWDSVGMTAQVGTDGDNSSVVNDFDKAAPFMRRKCVGEWSLVNGKAVFTVNAYYGDADYTEDGTKGDYVAVECPLSYYYMDNGTLGISCYKHPGYRPFDIFCRDHNEDDVMPYYYLPAYALGVKDSKAVSLPGLDNVQGTYKGILDAARTYKSGALGGLAVIQPMAVNFYEWALFTVEFAVQNGQSVMMGCCNLRHNADDRATLRSDGKWLLSNYQAARVAGEYISIQGTSNDINSASLYASHKITSIIRCDANGDEDASGSYQLIETDDLGVGRTYEVGASYGIAARPYRTGSCNTVSTPSGSPVSNADGFHPMKYRWRENPYGNQYKTVVDLFNKRVDTGDSDWILEHYYLPKPQDYEPSSASKPDSTDLATNAFVKLDIETAHANYVNGYIKSKKYAASYPDIWIPFETDGGSTTYFADYALLVNSHSVRAVRLGGYWLLGAFDGFSSFSGSYAPSHGSASSGGDLCIIQDTGG